MHEQRVDKSEYKIPAYCHNCGEPYPWTKAALDAAAELIDEEMNELTGEEKSTFKAALPDVVAQNPRTTLASRRISKCLKKIAPTIKKHLNRFFIDLRLTEQGL